MQDYFIMPCNVNYYDIISHFENSETIVWKRSCSIHLGDIVYIYVGKPYSEIKYRCEVINENVDDETLEKNKYAIPTESRQSYFRSHRIQQYRTYKYVQLKLERTFPEGALSLLTLKEHGLGQVQKQARVSKELREFIRNIEATDNLEV